MKRFLVFGVIFLAISAFDCGGGGPTPTPTPRPTKTAIPSPTATAVPPTATPIPPTPTPTAIPIKPTEDPNMETYRLAKAVGVNQNAYSAAWPFPRHGGILDQFTTKELFDELQGYNIRAVRLWLSVPYNDGFNGPPIYEDMHEVWSHPGIDTMVIIFTDERWTNWVEPGCTTARVIADVSEPTYEIATFLYENYGYLDKTIIITEPEIDNLWRGYDCSEPNDALWELWPESVECRLNKTAAQCAYEMSMPRMDEAIARAEKRQVDVERARAEHPDANLVVASSITVSQFDELERYFNKFALRDGISDMDPSPDYLGMSQGASGGRDFAFPIQQVKLFTGYPMDRLFVDQVYMTEKYPGVQYNLIKPAIQVAFNWDVQLALVWMWKQGWISYNAKGQPQNQGMWQWLNEIGVPGKAIYGDPTSGFQAIQEMNPGATTPTPIPPTATPRPPTATPTATPTPADPCAHCPDPASFSCQMWPDTCIQCWDECGQPYVTPTPTRTPTRTKTPTPKPGDCSHCPDPNSMSCQMWPHTCYPCWEACGQPLATPTPRPATPTPTPKPPPDHLTLLPNYEGFPVTCDVSMLHESSGLIKTTTITPEECKSIDLYFKTGEQGYWRIQVTVQYAHGWAVGEIVETDVTAEDPEDILYPMFVRKLWGDVDEDGLYEHVYVFRPNIVLVGMEPEGPTT